MVRHRQECRSNLVATTILGAACYNRGMTLTLFPKVPKTAPRVSQSGQSTTAYMSKINELLQPKNKHNPPIALDLFAGCGGLALGFEAQGFKTLGFEMDQDCCDTYNFNLNGDCTKAFLTIESELPKADLIIGGPPCQPFSVRGKQKGLADERNGFPAFVAAVEKVRPRIFMFENVRGLLYKNRAYFDEIVISLEALGYKTHFAVLNAVHYNVPQNRERVVVVGTRPGIPFEFPRAATNKITVGEALGEMMTSASDDSKYLTDSMDTYIAKYEAASFCKVPRDLHSHKPARTLTCRNLCGATSDMHRIKLPDGRRRRISSREAARLQSFPDWYSFSGPESSVFNQIGNAVAPMFAYNLAGAIVKAL